jgi:two-component sensor histidine kinase
VTPAVAIGAIRAGGVAQDISELGETAVEGLELPPDRRQLEVDYFALSFGAGDAIRYQYKLERVDRDWSGPTDRRTISYAALSPGRYRFLVRAIDPDGAISTAPASLAFSVLAPVWQRWWFLSVAGVLVTLLFYGASRYRLERLLELERIRTRIATDLHDDIGASLSQIAILSEVTRRRVETSGAPPTDSLTRIAAVSRELVDSMSDIVWAVDPDKDRVASLAARMRRLASELLASGNIEVQFEMTGEEQDRRVAADVRRQVYLILKESLNNVLRHSHAAAVAIELHIAGGRLVLTIHDDGCGFDVARASDGRGLANLRDRARRLGGAVDIQSTEGGGTTVVLAAPLGNGHMYRWVTRSSV